MLAPTIARTIACKSRSHMRKKRFDRKRRRNTVEIMKQPRAPFKKARRYRMRIAWSVWFFAAVFVLFQFFLQLSSGVIVSAVMESYSLDAFGAGLLMSSYYYIYVLLQAPAGGLIDRYGTRWVLCLGAFCVSMGCILFAEAQSFAFALAGRVMMGGGASFAFVGCLNVASLWFPSRRFAFMAAIVEAAGMIGAITGNYWLADTIHHIGWQRCMLFAGIFALFLSFALFMFVRNSPRRKSVPRAHILAPSFFTGVKQLASKRILWINGIYSGAMFSIVAVFAALWAIPFLRMAYHLDLRMASAIASTLYVGVAVGGPFLGWLDSRLPWRRPIMIFNAFLSASCLILAVFLTTLPLVLVGVCLFFAGVCASSYVLTFAIANEIPHPAYRATSIGLTNMLCVFFAPILQPLVGFLFTHYQEWHWFAGETMQFQWAIMIIPLFLTISGFLAIFLPGKN